MNSSRQISRAAGALLVVATVAALVAAALLPALTGTGYLARVADHPGKIAASALAYLIAAGTSVAIAIALYPLLKGANAALALGAVVFRTIEAVFYLAAVVSLLSISSLGQQFATAPVAARAPIQALADYAVSTRDHSTLAAVFAFSVGAFLYYLVFYRSRLVPRWLSGWGLVGALLMGSACLLSLVGDSPVADDTLLILPIAVQEMVFAVWLLAKGFNSSSGEPAIGTGAMVLDRPRSSR